MEKQKRKEIEKISEDNNRSAPYNCGLFDFQAISLYFSFRFVSVYNGASIISEKRKKKKTHKTTVNKYVYKPLVFISVHVLVVEWGRAVGERRFSWPAPGENVSNDERNDYEIIVMKSSAATKQKQVVKEASRQ